MSSGKKTAIVMLFFFAFDFVIYISSRFIKETLSNLSFKKILSNLLPLDIAL